MTSGGIGRRRRLTGLRRIGPRCIRRGGIGLGCAGCCRIGLAGGRPARGDADVHALLAADGGVGGGLRRGGPIIRFEKLILHGTHHRVLAGVLEQRPEGHVRIQRKVALLHAREIGGELWECCARRIAVELDHSIETAAPEGHLGATVAQMASVAWQYRHCSVVTQDSACLKNIHNRRGRLLLQIA